MSEHASVTVMAHDCCGDCEELAERVKRNAEIQGISHLTLKDAVHSAEYMRLG